MNMADMNTLQYVTVLTVAGVKEQFEPEKVKEAPRDPDHGIKTQIKKTRKWIARLTAIEKNGGKLTQKVKSYLRKRSLQAVLQQYRMRLAAMCKGMKTRNSVRNRFRNNKLHCFNVKALYYKLWFGDSGGVSNPPPDEAVKKYLGCLFGDRAKHNDDADWIKEEEEEM